MDWLDLLTRIGVHIDAVQALMVGIIAALVYDRKRLITDADAKNLRLVDVIDKYHEAMAQHTDALKGLTSVLSEIKGILHS